MDFDQSGSVFFIGISGNIGAGKTSCAEALGRALEWPVHLGPAAASPFLVDFDRDMRRWAFHLQVDLLAGRFAARRAALRRRRRFIHCAVHEDAEIFARMLHARGAIDARDHACLLGLLREMVAVLPPPGLLLYLHARPEVLLQRIAARRRGWEKWIALGDLQALDAAYRDWLPRARKLGPVIEVDTSEWIFPPSASAIAPLAACVRRAAGDLDADWVEERVT